MRSLTLLMLACLACVVGGESLVAADEAAQQRKPAGSPSTDRASRARFLDGFSLAQSSSLLKGAASDYEYREVDYEAIIAAAWQREEWLKQREEWLKQAPERQSQLQKKYPIESLRSRLAYEERWPAYAADLRQKPIRPRGLTERAEALRKLHQATTEEFVSRPDFGFGRHRRRNTEDLLLLESGEPLALESSPTRPAALGPDAPLKLSDIYFSSAEFAGRAPTKQLLREFDAQSQDIFANASWLGYAESLDRVTGFMPHQFWTRPELGTGRSAWELNVDSKSQRKLFDRWRNTRLQLVSLLKHPEPRVYVSENLPAMKELEDVETRELDRFEQAALLKLRAPVARRDGGDVVIEATTNTIRMIGPLRAAAICSDCHQVKAGHLLGAFSYVFERDPPISAAAAAKYVDDTSGTVVRKRPAPQPPPLQPQRAARPPKRF